MKRYSIDGFKMGLLIGGMFGLYAAIATIDYNNLFLKVKDSLLIAFYSIVIYGIFIGAIMTALNIILRKPAATFTTGELLGATTAADSPQVSSTITQTFASRRRRR